MTPPETERWKSLRRRLERRGDAVLALILLMGTIGYLLAFPLRLGFPDEGHALHEAKRVLDGEIPYRDIFDLTTPGWIYLMGALFWLFGTTLSTARATIAVVHGATVAVMFLACRRAGVRPGIASAAGLAYLVLCQVVYPVASQHWLATFLSLVLLLLCLRTGRSARGDLLIGVMVGLLITVHQARGFTMGAAAVVAVSAGALIGRHAGEVPRWTDLTARPTAIVAGALLVVLPVLALLIGTAGFGPIWEALVIYPSVNYRTTLHVPWAGWGPRLPRAFPSFLEYMPVVVALGAIRLAVPSLRDPVSNRAAFVLAVFCVFSILSISYFPGRAHLAFIGPVLIVTFSESLEWALRRLPGRLARASVLVSFALLGSVGFRLYSNLAFARRVRLAPQQTAFGPIELHARTIAFLEKLDELLRRVPGRVVYVHPVSAYTYLLAGARNPTPFEFMIGGYSGPDQVDEVIDTLRTGRVPYVVANMNLCNPSDRIASYIRKNYEHLTHPNPSIRNIWRLREREGSSSPS